MPPSERALLLGNSRHPLYIEAEGWAYDWHDGQIDRDGRPHIEHVRRVASMVPADCKVVAYLHDVLEDCPEASVPELELRGVELRDRRAVAILTRHPRVNYFDYVRDIANAVGEPGVIARAVKEADLVDNLARCLRRDDDAQDRYRRALMIVQQGMVGR